jgi:MFS family permease
VEQFMELKHCPSCEGARLKKESLWFKVADKNIAEISHLNLDKLLKWFEVIEKKLSKKDNAIAKDILKAGPIGFGWLNAASDMGAIIIIFIITLFPANRGQGKKLLLAVAGFGICIIVFALSKIFWLSFTMLLLSGVLDGFSMIVRGTIVQLKTPDHMRGRVMSVNSMFVNSSNELGQFESGVAAKAMGVIPSVVFGGAMTLLVVGITWFKAPSLKKMEY